MPASPRRNILLGVTTVVLLVAAGYLYFSRAGAEAELPQEYTVDGVCLACGQEVHVVAKITDPQPYVCSSCGERAVYTWLYCYDCNKRFVPRLQASPGGGLPNLPVIPSCSECGSSNVSQYVPADATQQAVGDAPLPDWPPK